MNVADRHNGPLLTAIEGTVASAFGKAYRVWIRGYRNFMVFAVKDGEPKFGRLRTLSNKAPHDPDWEALAVVAKDIASAATVVLPPKDESRILTDDLSPVERLTDESARMESRDLLGEPK